MIILKGIPSLYVQNVYPNCIYMYVLWKPGGKSYFLIDENISFLFNVSWKVFEYNVFDKLFKKVICILSYCCHETFLRISFPLFNWFGLITLFKNRLPPLVIIYVRRSVHVVKCNNNIVRTWNTQSINVTEIDVYRVLTKETLETYIQPCNSRYKYQ